VELWTSLDGKGSMDLEVDEFVDVIDRQRRRSIVRMDAKKNKIWVQVLLITKAKKKQSDW